ncbi:MAG: hypothetical protein ACRC8C_02800 [Mycoplasmoidaceae bacterium]
MSNKNINIVNRKKTNINDKKVKDSLITMFLLPSSILTDDEDKIEKCENSYSFLENESNGVLYKFKTSIPYFQKLKKEFIDKNYIVKSDDFFEINSVDLFALQTITEFTNNKFTYKTQKNYYKVLLENTEFFELSEKIITLNKYIVALSDLFNIIETNLFDISSAMTISIDEYVSKFTKDKIMISNLLFGRNLKLQDLIKKIKLCSYETDKKLIEKIKKLELEYDINGFLYKDDFLKFLFYTMEEIKNLFASIIVDLIPAIDVLWKDYEIKLEEDKIAELKKQEEKEKQKEASLLQKIKNVKIPEINYTEKLKNISFQKKENENETIFGDFDNSNPNLENSDIVIEEYDFSNKKYDLNCNNNFEESIIPETEDEIIEWEKNDELINNECNSFCGEENQELGEDKSFNEEENLELEDDESFNEEENQELEDDESFNEEDLELWNTMVDVNDDDFESKQNETNENNFINETEDLIYNTLMNEISDLDDEEDSLWDDEEAITKNMDSLINEIKDSIKEEDNDNSNEESEY